MKIRLPETEAGGLKFREGERAVSESKTHQLIKAIEILRPVYLAEGGDPKDTKRLMRFVEDNMVEAGSHDVKIGNWEK